jgi:hypothetical protein
MPSHDPEDAPPYFDDIRDTAYAQILWGLLELVSSRVEDFDRIRTRDRLWLSQGGFSPMVIDAYEHLTGDLWSRLFRRQIEAVQGRRVGLSRKALTPRRVRGGRPRFAETAAGKQFLAKRQQAIDDFGKEHAGAAPSAKELAARLGIAYSTLRSREKLCLPPKK